MAKTFEEFKSEYQRLNGEIKSYEREFENRMETALDKETEACKYHLADAISTFDRLTEYRKQLYHLIAEGFCKK